MEIQLKEKQLQIIAAIQTEKLKLQQEFKRLTDRETEVLVLICEGAGVDSERIVGEKLEIKEGGILVIPAGVSTPPETKKKK